MKFTKKQIDSEWSASDLKAQLEQLDESDMGLAASLLMFRLLEIVEQLENRIRELEFTTDDY